MFTDKILETSAPISLKDFVSLTLPKVPLSRFCQNRFSSTDQENSQAQQQYQSSNSQNAVNNTINSTDRSNLFLGYIMQIFGQV